MFRYKIQIVLFFLFAGSKVFAQAGLGDPLINFTFGAGSAVHGPAFPGLSSYTFTNADFPPEGSYTIVNNTAGAGNIWWPTADHSGKPPGYMMVMNTGPAGFEVLFKNQVNGLCPGTSYEFGAYFLNLIQGTDNLPPDIVMRVETLEGVAIQPDIYVGKIDQSPTGPQWVHKTIDFTVPPNISQVYVLLINQSPGGPGTNDVAIDDIAVYAKGPLITASFNGPGDPNDRNTCADDPQTYTLTVTPTEPGNVLQWQQKIDDGKWTKIPNETTDTYTFTSLSTPGIYRYRVATATPDKIDFFSCSAESNELSLWVKPLVAASTEEKQLLYLRGSTPVTLKGATNSTNFAWEVKPGGADIGSLSSTTVLNPKASPNVATTYILKAKADAGTCGPEAIDTVMVIVADGIKLPNTFTPNGDGVNDRWIIDGINTYPNAVIQIFNRNGQLVFRSVGGSASPWNGTYNGKNVPAGNYYYIIDLNIANLKFSGSVAVIR